MTTTVNPPQSPAPSGRPPHRRRTVAVVAAAVLAAGGLGAGLAVAFSGSSSSTGTSDPSPGSAGPSAATYSYYRQVMGHYRLGSGSMMRGYGWMAGTTGYGWMMGGTAAPGWMTGGTLPGFMTGGNTDPGKVMGSLFADAPGPRVSETDATRLGNQVPAGATADRDANTLTFTSPDVAVTVLASPSMPAENFRIAGMTNPTVSVPAGARVSIDFINADGDMAHGLVVTASGAASSPVPMMTNPPAFAGAALWFLGASTSAGMHEATISFTATGAGSYRYLCAIPGHAQEGMTGVFIVR